MVESWSMAAESAAATPDSRRTASACSREIVAVKTRNYAPYRHTVIEFWRAMYLVEGGHASCAGYACDNAIRRTRCCML